MVARGERLLTAKEVASSVRPGRYSDGGGLYLAVSEGGRRRWVWQYQWHARTREMGLGSASEITLKEAREERDKWRAVLKDGKDPVEERKARLRAAVPVPTFGQCADELVATKTPEWRNAKHAAQWKMTLDVYAKPIRALPVNQVETRDVLALLQPIWLTKPETGSRVRSRIEAVLDSARVHGHRGQHTANPARWRGHLSMLLPKRPALSRGHHAALPYTELPAFMAALRERPGMAALALEFTILTAARSGEALGALKAEIDLKERLWTVPAERMKSKRPHRVPLSEAAIELAKQAMQLSSGPYLFAGARHGRSLSDMALEMVLRRMEVEATVHGMRSTFRDWAGDKTTFPREVAEAALAHAVGDKAEQAYRRSDALQKRRKLMDAWASFCGSMQADNVVAFAKPDAGA